MVNLFDYILRRKKKKREYRIKFGFTDDDNIIYYIVDWNGHICVEFKENTAFDTVFDTLLKLEYNG